MSEEWEKIKGKKNDVNEDKRKKAKNEWKGKEKKWKKLYEEKDRYRKWYKNIFMFLKRRK